MRVCWLHLCVICVSFAAFFATWLGQSRMLQAHPLDEMNTTVLDPIQMQAMDVLVSTQNPGEVKLGSFLHMRRLLDSDVAPLQVRQQPDAGPLDPGWDDNLDFAQQFVESLFWLFVDDKRVALTADFPNAEREGGFSRRGEDFVELTATIDTNPESIALAVHPLIEQVQVGLLDEVKEPLVVDLNRDNGYVVAVFGRAPGESVIRAPNRMKAQGSPNQTTLEVAKRYLFLGFIHILPAGLDHILFVLGLFLLAARWKPLIIQVSLFTLAHTLTLAGATMGWLQVPGEVVEPLIAISISYVALENLKTDQLGWVRMGVVFAFGLLHGLGFAGVFSELGFTENAFLTSLFAFNIGVEVGQLAVLVMALGLTYFIRQKEAYDRWVRPLLCWTIAIVGIYWAFERVLA